VQITIIEQTEEVVWFQVDIHDQSIEIMANIHWLDELLILDTTPAMNNWTLDLLATPRNQPKQRTTTFI